MIETVSMEPVCGSRPNASPAAEADRSAGLLGAGFSALLSQIMGNAAQPADLANHILGGAPQAMQSEGPATAVALPAMPEQNAGAPEQDPDARASGDGRERILRNSDQGAAVDMFEGRTASDDESSPLKDAKLFAAADPRAAEELLAGNDGQITSPQAAPQQAQAPSDNGFGPLLQAAVLPAAQQTSVPGPPAGSPHPAPMPGATAPAERSDGMATIAPDSTRLAVTLEPDGLGKLNINLSLDRGLVHAQINVADEHVRALLADRAHDIVQALLREGISVGGFSVSLRERGAEYGSDEPGGQPERREAQDAEPVAPLPAGVTRGLISIFA